MSRKREITMRISKRIRLARLCVLFLGLLALTPTFETSGRGCSKRTIEFKSTPTLVHTWVSESPGPAVEAEVRARVIALDKTVSPQTLVEIVRTLSHVLTISKMYKNADVDVALITEACVELRSDFRQRVETALTQAPSGWETLQLMTSNSHLAMKLDILYSTQFVKWYPNHGSVAAYLISKSGMESVMDAWSVRASDAVDYLNWKLPTKGYRPEDTIFRATRSYTASTALVNNDHRLFSYLRRFVRKPFKTFIMPSGRILVPDSVFIASYLRVEKLDGFREKIKLLSQNLVELEKCVPRVHMQVAVVCADYVVAAAVRAMLAKYDSWDVVFSVSVHSRRFNKFYFLPAMFDDILRHEKVLLLDSDMDLVGFPLIEYFELTSRFVISGTVHQNVKEMIDSDSDPPRQWYWINNGAWWQEQLPNVLLLETDFVEQAFTLMDSRFAIWFFHQILQEDLVSHRAANGQVYPGESDWGPDLLWCGAAADWLTTADISTLDRPCAISTFPVYHIDDRQRDIHPRADHSPQEVVGSENREQLELYAQRFPDWFAYSSNFVRYAGGSGQSVDASFRDRILVHDIEMGRTFRSYSDRGSIPTALKRGIVQ